MSCPDDRTPCIATADGWFCPRCRRVVALLHDATGQRRQVAPLLLHDLGAEIPPPSGDDLISFRRSVGPHQQRHQDAAQDVAAAQAAERVAAGAGALVYRIPLAIVIATVLAIVIASYRQTVRAYPGGGGSYIVAHENLGVLPGLVAAAALLTDYVLTVSVSVVVIASSRCPARASIPRVGIWYRIFRVPGGPRADGSA